MSIAATSEEIIRVQADQIASLQAALSTLEHENKRLHDQLMLILRRTFHKKSERLDPDQVRMFAEQLLASEVENTQAAEAVKDVVRTKKRKKGHGRARFPSHLPRETVEIELPAAERICSDCGREMREIGADVTERGHMVP